MAYRGLNSVLNGFPVLGFQVDTYSHFDTWMTYNGNSGAIARAADVTLSASLIGTDDGNLGYLTDKVGGRLLGLGTGYLCEYCNTYSPAGSAYCMRCTAPLTRLEFVRPFEFPFMMTERTINAPVSDTYHIDLTFRSIGDVTTDIFDMLQQRHLRLDSLPVNCNIAYGYYLCAYCGMAVKDGKECYGCGGGRLPYHEVVNMQRACVYCGNDAINGIWCGSCGARMSGEKLGDYIQTIPGLTAAWG